MTVVLNGLEELADRVGTHLGYSDWVSVTQDRIDQFAEATGDHQWIHVDSERARNGPFGGTIAHGYLTLSLVSALWSQIVDLRGVAVRINYGLNKVRFPAPLRAGSKVRLGATLAGVKEVAGGVEAVLDFVVEGDGMAKPVCVAQVVHRYSPEG